MYIVLFLNLASPAQAFDWPFNTEEFQKKISSNDLAPSTRYFARGPSYLASQIWSETKFLAQLEQQNYRLRSSEQILMAGDAKKLSDIDCKSLSGETLLDSPNTCWTWQTHDEETYYVIISPNQTIRSTWRGANLPEKFWKASLDPVLVAQYKGQQPVMQNHLPLSNFPVNCLNATMAIEDSEFLNHSGLSYLGLTRSLLKNISQLRYAQGGSTITQQLVKNYFLTPEKTLNRKLKELYLAVKL